MKDLVTRKVEVLSPEAFLRRKDELDKVARRWAEARGLSYNDSVARTAIDRLDRGELTIKMFRLGEFTEAVIVDAENRFWAVGCSKRMGKHSRLRPIKKSKPRMENVEGRGQLVYAAVREKTGDKEDLAVGTAVAVHRAVRFLLDEMYVTPAPMKATREAKGGTRVRKAA